MTPTPNPFVQPPVRPDLVITRIFDAPRELVFKAWTDPKHVAKWWGPRDFTATVLELDVRPGGSFRIDMMGPDGVVIPGGGVFNEVVAPERLVFTIGAFPDETGRPQLEVHNTVTFVEQDGRTRLTLQARVLRSTPAVAAPLASMEQGWSESLERLAAHLRSSCPP